MKIMETDVMNIAETIEEKIITHRRNLHSIPETGLELPQTTRYVRKVLDELGIEYDVLSGGSALSALIRGKNTGRTIALRADMDALPVVEETGLPFASSNGNMHACGHDGHTAMLLGAAEILNNMKETFNGNIKLFFQPGEEYPGGAEQMINDGCMENPHVDAVLGLHEGNISPGSKPGTISISYGNTMASVDHVEMTVIGRGGHGASPQMCSDPVLAACQIVCSLQQIVSRNTAPSDSAVVSVCNIHGGSAENIIPKSVYLEGTVRALNPETRQMLYERIREISEYTAKAAGCTVDFKYEFSYPPLKNDREFTEDFKKSALKILPAERIEILEKPLMGSDDMAYFLQKAPGTYFFLNNPKEKDGKIYPHHSPFFDIDESYLKLGTALLVQSTLDYLSGEYRINS